MEKIFFSYSRHDGQPFALKLWDDLKNAGANVWLDQVDIEPGKPWDEEIEKALQSANCILFIATEKSTSATNVLNEVYYALDENKQVIPVIFHPCKIPFRLRRLQNIDFTKDYDTALKRLLKALQLSTPSALKGATALNNTEEEKELLVWNTAKGKDNIEAYEEYLSYYPQGKFSAEAKNTLAEIKEENSKQQDAGNSYQNNEPLVEMEPDEPKPNSKRKAGIAVGLVVLLVLAFALYKYSDLFGAKKNESVASNSKETDDNNTARQPYDSFEQSTRFAEADKDNLTTKPQDKNTIDVTTDPSKETGNNELKEERNHLYYFNLGRRYMAKGDYTNAIENFNKAISINAKAPGPYYQLGILYTVQKKYDAAIKYFSGAIDLSPKEAVYLSSRANVFYTQKEFSRSLQDWNSALSIMPKEAKYYTARGLTHIALNNNAAACTDFSQAASLGDVDGTTYSNQYCRKKPDIKVKPGVKNLNPYIKSLNRKADTTKYK